MIALPQIFASLSGTLLSLTAPSALQTIRANAAGTAWEKATPGWLDTAQTWSGTQTFGGIDARQSADGAVAIDGRRFINTSGGTGFLIRFRDATPSATLFSVDTKGSIFGGGTLTLDGSSSVAGTRIDAGNVSTVNNTFPAFRFRNYYTTSGSGSVFLLASQSDSGGARFTELDVAPTINQSSTAGFRVVRISPFLQATGSGTKLLLDIGTNSAAAGGGTHTSLFTVDTSGVTQAAGYKSSDGSAGATGTATSANTLTVKNGLITNIA